LKGLCRADGGIRDDHVTRPLLSAWNVKVGTPLPGSETYEQFRGQGINIERRVLSIDTAATSVRPGRDPDYTVIMLWGLDTRRGLRVCLDIARFRTGSPRKFREILKEMAYAYQPHRIVMETNAMAIWIAKDAQDAIGYPIKPHVRGSDDIERLEEFKSLAESGMLLYCWGDERSARIMGPFEQELDEYPGGSHDDTLIAAVQAQEFLKPRREKVKAYTGESLRPPERRDPMARVRGELDKLRQELDATLEKVDAHVGHY
jgi:phage terminase large subunit-like protein